MATHFCHQFLGHVKNLQVTAAPLARNHLGGGRAREVVVEIMDIKCVYLDFATACGLHELRVYKLEVPQQIEIKALHHAELSHASLLDLLMQQLDCPLPSVSCFDFFIVGTLHFEIGECAPVNLFVGMIGIKIQAEIRSILHQLEDFADLADLTALVHWALQVVMSLLVVVFDFVERVVK